MTKRSLSDTSASSSPSPRAPETGDTSPLRRLTHALESVTRNSDSWTSGFSARFPLPALAFKGDDEQELLLPLRSEDSQVIKKRGVVSQHHEGVDVAWEVRGDLIESRNPEWHDFMDERLAKIRARLGIFDREEVEMPLRKMVLAEMNARLLVEEDAAPTRASGAFGTFVVVLPGKFEGGDVLIHRQNEGLLHEKDDGSEDEWDDDDGWWSDSRDHPYYVSYAAFYDHCKYVAKPLQRGSALCLVFDLVTTPSQVDLLRGPHSIQHYVDSALSDYFRVVPEPLAKRLKISSDAWKTVTEFVTDHSFLYIFKGKQYEERDKTFEDLARDERLIAESLAAFCAQSNGGYVLYLARVLCSRFDGWPSTSDHASNGGGGDSMADRFVTIKGPWIQLGESSPKATYPPVYIDHHRNVAPLGRVDKLPLNDRRHYGDDVDIDIAEQLYGDRYCVAKCAMHSTYALVVLPVSVEATQCTQVPVPEAVMILRAKLAESREEARRYARRVVSYRREWRVYPYCSDGFADFVKLLVELNDRPLFCDFLQPLELPSSERTGALSKALQHFGWAACEETIIHRLRSAPALCDRVNLFVSVVDPCERTDRVDKLLDALLSQYPWTHATVDRHVASSERNSPSSIDVEQLLDIVYRLSPRRLIQVVSSKDVHLLVLDLAPAVASFVKAHLSDTLPWRVLVHVRSLFKSMALEIRNHPYAQVLITDHCSVCSEIRAFLASTVNETVVRITTPTDIEHIDAVLEDALNGSTPVETNRVGKTAVRLIKTQRTPNLLQVFATDPERKLDKLLARSDRPPLPELMLEAVRED